MKVVTYYRYSTNNEMQQDNSEARQKHACEEVIQKNKWIEVKTYTDHATSGLGNKPQLMQLKEDVENGSVRFDTLLIDTLSRLSRKSITRIREDIQWIDDNNIKISCRDIDGGKAFTVSQIDDDPDKFIKTWGNNSYSKNLSGNVITGINRLWKENNLGWFGSAPYGYNLIHVEGEKKKLSPNEDLPIIKDIYEDVLNGGSLNGCIKYLKKLSKFKNNTDKKPVRQTVYNILRNPIYCGIRTLGVRNVAKFDGMSDHKHRHVVQNPLVQAADYQQYNREGFEPCITLEQFTKVQNILDTNQKNFKKFPERQKYKYSGLLRCSCCGTALNAAGYTDSQNNKMMRYVCPRSADSSDVCSDGIAPKRKQIRTDEFEELLPVEFAKLFNTPEFIISNTTMLLERIIKRSKSNIDNIDSDYEIQSKRLDELFKLGDELGYDVIKERIAKQAEIVEALKAKRDEFVEEDDLLGLAKSLYEEDYNGKIKSYGRNKFITDSKVPSILGMCYRIASEAAGLDSKKKQQDYIEEEAIDIIYSKEVRENRKNIVNGKEVDVPTWNGKPIKPSKPKTYDSEAIMQMLNRSVIQHINVIWEMSTWRGRRRRVPVSLEFVFSLALENYKGKLVVGSSNQMQYMPL